MAVSLSTGDTDELRACIDSLRYGAESLRLWARWHQPTFPIRTAEILSKLTTLDQIINDLQGTQEDILGIVYHPAEYASFRP